MSRNVSEEDWNLDELSCVVEEVVAHERVIMTQTMKPRRDNNPPPSATTLVTDVKGLELNRVVVTVTKTTLLQVAM